MAMRVIQFGIIEFQKYGITYKWPDEIRKPTHEVEEVPASSEAEAIGLAVFPVIESRSASWWTNRGGTTTSSTR